MFATITMMNLEKPLVARLGRLERFVFHPVERGVKSRFFYAESAMPEIETAEFGAGFRLRFVPANDFLLASVLSQTSGYLASDGDVVSPVVALLPRSRGFLAGWSLGPGMPSGLDLTVWKDDHEAARHAHQLAEEIAAEMARQADEVA